MNVTATRDVHRLGWRVAAAVALAAGFWSAGCGKDDTAESERAAATAIRGVKQAGPVLGESAAPATLTVFARADDIRLRPFVDDVLPELTRRFVATGKLKVMVRTIADGGNANRAVLARAVQAAGLQNRFYDTLAAVAANYRGTVSAQGLPTVVDASETDVDTALLRRDMRSPRVLKAVERGGRLASERGVAEDDLGFFLDMPSGETKLTSAGIFGIADAVARRVVSLKGVPKSTTTPGSPTAAPVAGSPAPRAGGDPRDITRGRVIPDEGYVDQPYVVVTREGSWLAVMTTGQDTEGQPGQHVVSTISRDQGRTWSRPVDVEPARGPEASWAVPYITPYGRIYVFYTYNLHDVRTVPDGGAFTSRVDTLGAYVYRYSDDNGKTWSRTRHRIPIRTNSADRTNNFRGKTLMFWGVGKPVFDNGSVYWGWTRVTRWGDPAAQTRSQGQIMVGDNLATERDPARLRWTVLPDDPRGLRAPKASISEEATVVPLSDGSLYATYRTVDGYLSAAYSRDKGRTWTPPAYATFADGRRIKHPRAYGPVWRLRNGKYLLWFNNYGGDAAQRLGWAGNPDRRGLYGYQYHRNPIWASAGVERDGRIEWSQPQVLLYDPSAGGRISYPDLIEDRGEVFITETQKTTARVHKLDAAMLARMWAEVEKRGIRKADPVVPGAQVTLSGEQTRANTTLAAPSLPDLSSGSGFTIDFWSKLDELTADQRLLDTRGPDGVGIALSTTSRFTLRLTLNDGARRFDWESDFGTGLGTLKAGKWQHVSVIADARANIISFVIDGAFNDGGAVRPAGWSFFPRELGNVSGSIDLRLARQLRGRLGTVRFYSRPLATAEAVQNFRAGPRP